MLAAMPAMLRLMCQAAGRSALHERFTGPLTADAPSLRAPGRNPAVAARAGLAALMRDERNGRGNEVGTR
jgi:hypothetical protein